MAISLKLRGDAHYCSARCRQREYRARITTRSPRGTLSSAEIDQCRAPEAVPAMHRQP
jgi:hypothetical protein